MQCILIDRRSPAHINDIRTFRKELYPLTRKDIPCLRCIREAHYKKVSNRQQFVKRIDLLHAVESLFAANTAPAAKAVEPAPAAPAPVGKKAVKPAKRAAAKKKPAEKKEAAPKKAAAKKPVPTVILQSPFGGEITVDAVKTLVGDVDKVYVRIDQNKLYWVKGKETGDTDIW